MKHIRSHIGALVPQDANKMRLALYLNSLAILFFGGLFNTMDASATISAAKLLLYGPQCVLLGLHYRDWSHRGILWPLVFWIGLLAIPAALLPTEMFGALRLVSLIVSVSAAYLGIVTYLRTASLRDAGLWFLLGMLLLVGAAFVDFLTQGLTTDVERHYILIFNPQTFAQYMAYSMLISLLVLPRRYGLFIAGFFLLLALYPASKATVVALIAVFLSLAWGIPYHKKKALWLSLFLTLLLILVSLPSNLFPDMAKDFATRYYALRNEAPIEYHTSAQKNNDAPAVASHPGTPHITHPSSTAEEPLASSTAQEPLASPADEELLAFLLGNAGSDSLRLRLSAWKDCLKLWKEHPFGIGVGQWKHYWSYAKDFPLMTYPHNLYLELLVEYGSLFALLILGFMLYPFLRRKAGWMPLHYFGLYSLVFQGVTGGLVSTRFFFTTLLLIYAVRSLPNLVASRQA